MNHKRVQQKPEGESLTVQSAAQAADINAMAERHLKGPNRLGPMVGNPLGAPRQPRFMDLSSADSYHDMLNKVSRIDSIFASLPSRLRTRFRNNPELLLRFVEDPANAREAVKLGLISDPDVIQAVREAEREEAIQLDLEEQAKKAGEYFTASEAGDANQAAKKPPTGAQPPGNPA